MRGTGSPGTVNWLSAVTTRYKLVISPKDVPWLFDLQTDPDELTNVFQVPQYRDTLRALAEDLLAYGKAYDDPYVTDLKMNADLKWAAHGQGPYVPTASAGPVKRLTPKNANKRNRKQPR